MLSVCFTCSLKDRYIFICYFKGSTHEEVADLFHLLLCDHSLRNHNFSLYICSRVEEEKQSRAKLSQQKTPGSFLYYYCVQFTSDRTDILCCQEEKNDNWWPRISARNPKERGVGGERGLVSSMQVMPSQMLLFSDGGVRLSLEWAEIQFLILLINLLRCKNILRVKIQNSEKLCFSSF